MEALNQHNNSDAHRKNPQIQAKTAFYCATHQKYFQSLEALNQHNNSDAHRKNYCPTHKKQFKSLQAYQQHMSSPAHEEFESEEESEYSDEEYNSEEETENSEEEYESEEESENSQEEFYCSIHDRYFKSEEAYDQHMNSPAHEDDSESSEMPPDPVDTPGYWVAYDEFENYKSFGYFKCDCEAWWMSAHAFKNYKQGCKLCDDYSYATYFWVNEEDQEIKGKSKKENRGNHLRDRCEACEAGECTAN